MTSLAEFFFNSKSNVVLLELVEISHPSFSQTYRIVRNRTDGVTVIAEDNQEYLFSYLPIELEKSSARTDLDYAIKVSIGDVGKIISQEIDRVRTAGTFEIYPSVIYREYRSDDLSEPLLVVKNLQIEDFAFNGTSSTFEAKTENYNLNGTGEVQSFDRFPMQRDMV